MKYLALLLAITVAVTEGLTPESIALMVFIIWSIPLTVFRTRFRKIVYKTDDWKIALKPVFTQELRALFGNTQPGNDQYLKTRNFYRLYLSVFVALYITWSILRNMVY